MLTEDFGWSNIKSVKNIVGLLFVFFCLSVSLVQATTVTPLHTTGAPLLGLGKPKSWDLRLQSDLNAICLEKSDTRQSFYFVKPWQERIQLALTFDQKQKQLDDSNCR